VLCTLVAISIVLGRFFLFVSQRKWKAIVAEDGFFWALMPMGSLAFVNNGFAQQSGVMITQFPFCFSFVCSIFRKSTRGNMIWRKKK
jgi:hypothetical protein